MGNNYTVIAIKTQKESFKNNVYVIYKKKSKNAVVVDPSWELQKIRSVLDVNGCNLKGIILTHAHYDHVNLVATLKKQYQVPVYIGKNEEIMPYMKDIELEKVTDDSSIEIEDLSIDVIETAGHTKGSLCFLIEKEFFTGDTLFIEGCGICGDNKAAEDMFESLQKIKGRIDLSTKIYPGHTYFIESGQTMEYLYENNIYVAFKSKESFVKYRMRENQKSLFRFK